MATITYFPTVSSGASGATTNWFAAKDAVVYALDSTLTTRAFFSDLQLAGDVTLGTSGGTGVNALLQSQTGGIVQTKTGTTSGTNCTGYNSTTNPTFVSNARTQHWAIAMRAKIIAAPLAGTAFMRILDITDATTTDSFLGILPGTSATNYSTSATAAHDTGVPFDTTAYHDFLTWGDATNMRFYVDGVLVDTVAQVQAANGVGRFSWYIQNGNQSANVELNIDKVAAWTATPA